MPRLLRTLAIVGGTAALGITGAAPALADVERRATCSVDSFLEVDADYEYGFIELDVEVETPTAGQDWRLVVRKDGKRVYSNTRTARKDYDDRYADVDWEVVERNKRGTRERFVITATNQETQEQCRLSTRL